jgi:hypothetical protein
MMKPESDIVACGGWIKREYRTQPFTVLVGCVAFVAAVVTGILGISAVVLWRIDGVIPFTALWWTIGGIPVTAVSVAFTAFVAKREPERTIFRYNAPNPEHDPRKLY